MSWIPAPLITDDDDRIPIVVDITPAQAVRLELLIAKHRGRNPTTDDNAVVDFVFALGLDAAELAIDLEQPE